MTGKHRAPTEHRNVQRAAVVGAAVMVGGGLAPAGEPAQAGEPPVQAAVSAVPVTTAVPLTGTLLTTSGQPVTYRVVRGDTLWGIGTRVGESWQQLYAANRGVIGADPNLIFPGEVLAIAGPVAVPAVALSPAPTAPALVRHPLPGGVVTERFHPPFEAGVDLAKPLGTPILSATAGTVKYAGAATGYGDWIVVTSRIDGGTVDFVYGHEYPSGVLVHVGQSVAAGEQIGRVGSNGNSSGPHLEFCVWIGGLGTGHNVDPLTWLAAHGV